MTASRSNPFQEVENWLKDFTLSFGQNKARRIFTFYSLGGTFLNLAAWIAPAEDKDSHPLTRPLKLIAGTSDIVSSAALATTNRKNETTESIEERLESDFDAAGNDLLELNKQEEEAQDWSTEVLNATERTAPIVAPAFISAGALAMTLAGLLPAKDNKPNNVPSMLAGLMVFLGFGASAVGSVNLGSEFFADHERNAPEAWLRNTLGALQRTGVKEHGNEIAGASGMLASGAKVAGAAKEWIDAKHISGFNKFRKRLASFFYGLSGAVSLYGDIEYLTLNKENVTAVSGERIFNKISHMLVRTYESALAKEGIHLTDKASTPEIDSYKDKICHRILVAGVKYTQRNFKNHHTLGSDSFEAIYERYSQDFSAALETQNLLRATQTPNSEINVTNATNDCAIIEVGLIQSQSQIAKNYLTMRELIKKVNDLIENSETPALKKAESIAKLFAEQHVSMEDRPLAQGKDKHTRRNNMTQIAVNYIQQINGIELTLKQIETLVKDAFNATEAAQNQSNEPSKTTEADAKLGKASRSAARGASSPNTPENRIRM